MIEDELLRASYDRLVESILLMAAPPEDQIAAFPSYLDVPDEILIAFDESYIPFEGPPESLLLSAAAGEALIRLNRHLDTVAQNEGVGDPDTLAAHPFWKEVRTLASHALEVLGEPKRPPQPRQ